MLRVGVPAEASVKIMYEPQPTPRKISALSEKVIRAFACGHNHTLALDTEQAAYTWGDCISTVSSVSGSTSVMPLII